MGAHITVDEEELARWCKAHHIRRLALFGSVLRDDFGPESDVDVLVEFEPGQTPGLMGMIDLEDSLSPLVGGRKVDLRTVREISRAFRDEVVAGAEVRYAEG